jgi:predicted dehydrogenase
MRVGIVGCGYWGSNHLRLMRACADVQDVIVVEPNRATREQLIEQGDLKVFADLETALPLLDVAIIATPPMTHAALAYQCLRAGVSVLVEKPLATHSMDAQRLISIAAANSLTLMVGHTFEYNAAVWKLRDLVQSGDLGDIYFVDTARLNLGLYQSDVNVIWDLAPHDISILNFVLGAQPEQVAAWGSAFTIGTLEDVATVRLDYRSVGVSAHINVSWLAPQKVRRVTVVGSHKMAVYDDLLTDERIRVFDKGVVNMSTDPARGPASVTYRNGGIVSPFLDFVEPLKVLDEHFLRCVRLGHPVLTPGESGLAVVRVIEAAQSSLRSGGTAIPLTPEMSSVVDVTDRRMLVTEV